MKRYIISYVFASALILVGFLLFAVFRDTPPHLEIDTVAVNEIAKQAALCRGNPDLLDQMDFKYRFVFIDDNEEVVYASRGDMPDNMQSAIRSGFLPMNITTDGRVTGIVLIETTPDGGLYQVYATLSTVAVLAFLLIFTLNAILLMVFNRVVVSPLRHIERFAHKISTGVFDEPLPMEKSRLSGPFAQSFDIMRASLFEARQKQQAAERAQKELVATLSHDIKTPVTSIRLISELLQVSTTDPAAVEKLKTIELKTNQIDRLMNDMLYSALEELGELEVTPASVSSEVLLDLFKNADHLSKVRFGNMPSCLIELDSARMEQVIGNIIANSYKYAGTPIDVSFNVCGDGLQVDIDDYGKGVEQEELELITSKFYRGSNAKAMQKDGEGLGLYVAGQLMNKMGGGIESLNRADGFTIRLWIRLSH